MSTHEERLHVAKETIKTMRKTVRGVESNMQLQVRIHWNGRVKVDGEIFWEYEIDMNDTRETLSETYWKGPQD